MITIKISRLRLRLWLLSLLICYHRPVFKSTNNKPAVTMNSGNFKLIWHYLENYNHTKWKFVWNWNSETTYANIRGRPFDFQGRERGVGLGSPSLWQIIYYTQIFFFFSQPLKYGFCCCSPLTFVKEADTNNLPIPNREWHPRNQTLNGALYVLQEE